MENSFEMSVGFAEVYNIILQSKKELQDKIPEIVKNDIYSKMDKDFVFNKEQELSPCGKAILSVIITEFLADDETKIKFDKYDAYSTQLLEKEKSEKYKYEDMFKPAPKVEKTIESKETETTLIVQKESIIRRIFNKIKGFFSK